MDTIIEGVCNTSFTLQIVITPVCNPARATEIKVDRILCEETWQTWHDNARVARVHSVIRQKPN